MSFSFHVSHESTSRESLERLVDLRIHAMSENNRELMKSLLHPGYMYVDIDGNSYNLDQFLDAFFDQHSAQFFKNLPRHVKIDYEEPTLAEVSYYVDGTFVIKGRIHRGHFLAQHRLIRQNGSWIFSQGHVG